MMSVFCSKTLILAAECWKCIPKTQISKFYQGACPKTPLEAREGASFFHLRLLQSFCYLIKP